MTTTRDVLCTLPPQRLEFWQFHTSWECLQIQVFWTDGGILHLTKLYVGVPFITCKYDFQENGQAKGDKRLSRKLNQFAVCRYCARLIHGWGGKLGTLKGTDEGRRLMSKMKAVKIDDARALITKLITKGYDKSIPVRRSDQDILVSFDASAKLVKILKDCKADLLEACSGVDSAIQNLICLVECFRTNLEPFIISVSSKGHDVAENEFKGLYNNLQTNDDDSDEPLFNEYGCIDSDEEAQLYYELDCLMEAQERAMAFKGDSKKFMANAFQKLFLRIEEMETAFESVSYKYQIMSPLICFPILNF